MSQPPLPVFSSCSLYEWSGLRSQLLFGFERRFSGGEADGSFKRESQQYGAVLVKKGWYELRSGSMCMTARAGQWMFSFGRYHRQRFAPHSTVLALRMVHAWPDRTQLFVPPRKLLVFESRDHPEIETLGRRLVKSLGPVGTFPESPIHTCLQRSRLDLRAYGRHLHLLADWLELMFRVLPQYGVMFHFPKGMDPRLSKAMEAVEQLIHESAFSHTYIEQRSGLSMHQLDRLCRRSFDMTLRQYWNHLRVQHVKYHMHRSSNAIKQVAVEMGFTQLSNFSAWFKSHTGVSPRHYRETQWNERIQTEK